ncbi:Smr/MutS family protein [Brevundimonas bacteroides]|uniref:Smr/MutS family protein n=1 Tax=Brevundimonas bacteroides TaxID=74311 RepID=UPI0004957398|nr:Smr/MutS family protein [Brevundimonas bacteroides]
MARRPPPDLSAEDRRLWARVSGSVTPARVRKALRIAMELPAAVEVNPSQAFLPRPHPGPAKSTPGPIAAPRPTPAHGAPEALEPRRQRRLSRERDPIEATIDLHGFGRFEAEDKLRAFLLSAQARGLRAVLVVTGQGRRGGGVIRASIQEWLQSHALRGVVSGFASAHRRHGGDGAFYVTLRRRGA